MTSMQTIPSLSSLAERLRGDLVLPGDAAYDRERRVWNGMFDRRPAAIAQVEGAVDVVAVVDYARETGTELAVRGGGHSSAGYSTVDDGIVLDFSRMRGVRVDPRAKTACAQAGALWGDVDRETQAHGLAVPGGQISHTGIAGLTLGGGIGWLSRQHGLTIDNLLSVDLVTADGRLVTASQTKHPDLFWGLRGGSGNFGVVVSFEYRLHEVGPIVLGGPLVYELDDAAAALRNARDFFADAPDSVSLWLVLTHVPPQPPFPADRWGTPALALVPFCTDLERGPELLEPLTSFGSPVANLHGPIPYTALQSALDDVDPHGHRYWERGDYLTALSDDLIDALVDGARTVSSKRTEILLFPMGGAIARVPADATAFGDRSAPWAVWIASQWTDPAEDAIHRDWTRSFSESLTPWKTGSVYVNAIGADVTEARKLAAFGGAEKLERLRALKREWDPDNLFHRNHNVAP
jgi:FAD/FMN-containing dehydrogenase